MLLPRETIKAIALHSLAEAPREACGILSGGQAIACSNVSPFPLSRFEIESTIWLEHEVEGFYHSHPTGDKGFSEHDTKIARFLNLPSIVYIVETDMLEILCPDAGFSRITNCCEL